MTIRISPAKRVVCEAVITLPLSSVTVWGQLRDFHSFATHDQFHSDIRISGGVPLAGAGLVIEHRFFGFRVVRVGRILCWREERGFAFSDLSCKGCLTGFPHVLAFRVVARNGQQCQLIVRVTGRWTAPVPRFLARIWLWWVFSQIVRSTRNRLLWFAVNRSSRWMWGHTGH